MSHSKRHRLAHSIAWLLRHPLAAVRLVAARFSNEHNLHEQVQSHWRNTDDTFIVDNDYYDHVDEVLTREVIPLLRPDHTVLDAGCGNGRFTLLLAKQAATASAYDLSPKLIEQARETARGLGVTNVRFEVNDVQAASVQESFDMVVCMGVLVCLIDNSMFEKSLSFLADRVAPNGHLVLRETLHSEGRKISHNATHSGCYRPLEDYSNVLEEKGLTLISDITLATWSAQSTNHLLVFKKTQP